MRFTGLNRKDLYVVRLAGACFVAVIGLGWLAGTLWTASQQRIDGRPAREATGVDAGLPRGWVVPRHTAVSLQDRGLQLLGSSAVNTSDVLPDRRVTVINLWASWCPPCRREAPILQQLHEEGVDVRGISVDAASGPAIDFLTQHDVTYPNWRDESGAFRQQLQGVVPLTSFPSTVIVEDGRVVAAKIGEVFTIDELRQAVRRSR